MMCGTARTAAPGRWSPEELPGLRAPIIRQLCTTGRSGCSVAVTMSLATRLSTTCGRCIYRPIFSPPNDSEDPNWASGSELGLPSRARSERLLRVGKRMADEGSFEGFEGRFPCGSFRDIDSGDVHRGDICAYSRL